MKKQAKRPTPVVSVLNLKGGVGKTTISTHLFRIIAETCKLKVLLIDLDPQFNLSQAFLDRDKYEELKKEDKTVFAAMEAVPQVGILSVSVSSTPPPNPSELAQLLWKSSLAGGGHMDLVLGDFRLVKYSLLPEDKDTKAVRRQFLSFVELAKEEYDLVVIDCNPSSSFITSCAVLSSTHVLAPVRPDRYSLQGLEILNDLFEYMRVDPKPQLDIVVNGTRKSGTMQPEEISLRGSKEFGTSTLAAAVYHSSLLHAKQDSSGFVSDKKKPYVATVRSSLGRVAKEYAQKLGFKP